MNLFKLSSILTLCSFTFGGSVIAQESSVLVDGAEQATVDTAQVLPSIQAQYNGGVLLMQSWHFNEAEAVFHGILTSWPDSDLAKEAQDRLVEIAYHREGEEIQTPSMIPAPTEYLGPNRTGRNVGGIFGVALGGAAGGIFGVTVGGGLVYSVIKESNDAFAAILLLGGMGVGGIVGLVTGGVGGGIAGASIGSKRPIRKDKSSQSMRILPTLKFDRNHKTSYGLQASFEF